MQRRNFLKSTLETVTFATLSAGVGVSARQAAGQTTPQQTEDAETTETSRLPKIKLGNRQITRFIAGWNPIGGNAHAVPNLSKHMLEYFTEERVNDFLADCEIAGINAWQCSHGERAKVACDYLRRRGSKLNILVLHAERRQDSPIDTVIKDTNCFALVHHGNVTDSLFRAGKHQQVKDYLKKVHDKGIMVGLSSHCPDNIKLVADQDWENDFFMTCFYYITRPEAEQQKNLGKVVLGEPFFVSDPEEMVKVIQKVERPCLAFKILGAGRKCDSPLSTENAFKYAFENIKPTDAVVVGMYPKFRDEIAENVKFTKKYG
ncbi:MAG: hypothetical protein ACRC2T_03795 [Thermoguttaceae bacterium]